MLSIKTIPTTSGERASRKPYTLRDGRQCASPNDLTMAMRRTMETATAEQHKGAVFGTTVPSLIKFKALQQTMFEIALDKALLLGCRGLSLGHKDLIADDSRVITSPTPNSMMLRYSAWELADFLGVGAGCGNGKGNGVYQYQYHSFYFAEHHRGVWDTTTGKRLRDPFELFGSTAEAHDFYATLYKPSEIRKNALEHRTKLKAKHAKLHPVE